MQVIDFTKGIGYEIISFPDGEKHLRINELNRKDTVVIKCRIKSSDDLFIMMQLSDILNRQCVTVSRIYVYYLMSMRCDRLFSLEQPFTLKIVSDVINSFNAKEVIINEPHSDISVNLIKNSRAWNTKIDLPFKGIICHPDAGAYSRNGKEGDLYCSKRRDEQSGKLSSFVVENPQCYNSGDIVVVDDLCDGGGTFIGLAPKLRELNPSNLVLCVTHAIQLQGIERVSKVYDEVYITNSYNDWEKETLPDNVVVLNALL